ncbi:MAG: sulfate ABC transporter substrate-binding protein, partial [Defluviitaleaceae bacterium]|nr:sulfate ABC transporter substrate-binding protein [Defluviitaleaceae bacterium]
RELFDAYNSLFQAYWDERTGQEVEIFSSFGGSAAQARSVIDGNEADVVALALEHDVEELRRAGLVDEGWQDRFDFNSSPYTSTIVLVVRAGNPLNIQDWDDVVAPGIGVVTPNPRTSGGARWNFLAAWAFAHDRFGGDVAASEAFMADLYGNVRVLDSGARGSTITFSENEIGDVLLAWESDALLIMRERPGEFEIVTPSISILAQPMVAVVDDVARRRGTEEVSEAYLAFLYADEAQRLIGRNFYRPANPTILAEFADLFDLNVSLATVEDFGGWDVVAEQFFAEGGVFDRIYSE